MINNLQPLNSPQNQTPSEPLPPVRLNQAKSPRNPLTPAKLKPVQLKVKPPCAGQILSSSSAKPAQLHRPEEAANVPSGNPLTPVKCPQKPATCPPNNRSNSVDIFSGFAWPQSLTLWLSDYAWRLLSYLALEAITCTPRISGAESLIQAKANQNTVSQSQPKAFWPSRATRRVYDKTIFML